MGLFWMKRWYPKPGYTTRKWITPDSACIRNVLEFNHHVVSSGTSVLHVLETFWNGPHWCAGFEATISIRPVFSKSELITPQEYVRSSECSISAKSRVIWESSSFCVWNACELIFVRDGEDASGSLLPNTLPPSCPKTRREKQDIFRCLFVVVLFYFFSF